MFSDAEHVQAQGVGQLDVTQRVGQPPPRLDPVSGGGVALQVTQSDDAQLHASPDHAQATRMARLPWVWSEASARSASGAWSSSWVCWIGTLSVPASSSRASRCKFSGDGTAPMLWRSDPSPAAESDEAPRPSSWRTSAWVSKPSGA